MNEIQEVVQSAIPKVNYALEENVRKFLKFMSNPGQCRSCNAVIFWFSTKTGKPMPVNPDLTSHFSSCPQGREWRKQKDLKRS